MDHFTYKNDALHAEGVAIADIAAAVGTPFYVYSHATLTRHAQVFTQALAAVKPLICFAVKANSNIAVLKTLAAQGLGADVVSEGELRRALAAGISPAKIVFSGVGKTRAEMAFALKAGIHQFNVESDRELLALNEVAASLGKRAPIALRVNPDVDAKTHAKISTGKKENKFGIDIDAAPEIYALAASLPHLKVQGVSVHIGSQLTELAPFRAAYARVRELVTLLRARSIPIRTIDLGGGLGVPYASEDAPPPPAEYGALVAEMFGDFGAEFIFEPGRLICGNAGLLVTQVLYVKHAAHTYVIVDAGMNDLMRPALYDAVHAVVPVKADATGVANHLHAPSPNPLPQGERALSAAPYVAMPVNAETPIPPPLRGRSGGGATHEADNFVHPSPNPLPQGERALPPPVFPSPLRGRPGRGAAPEADSHHTPAANALPSSLSTVTVVGPVCESTDVFLKNVTMPLPAEGDLLALRTAGAYGASLSNGYNSRLLVPEVMVKGDQFAIIRPRPTYDAMLAGESIPEWV